MNQRRLSVLSSFLLAGLGSSGLVLTWAAAARGADKTALPPAAAHQVDFHREILPILANRCITCHARGRAEGGFSLETRTSTLQESDSGRAVLPGNSRESLLIAMVAGVDPEQVMPKQGRRLSSEEVGLLRAWIDQGVSWDADVSLRTLTLRAWKPRAVELPPVGPGLTHPIDRLMVPYADKHGVDLNATVDDRTFARRLYYDLIGLPPTPEELQSFLSDPGPDKRDRLAGALLDDRPRYADHWLSFWNDLLRNDYEGTGYIDGGRQQITGWLYDALLTNKPLGQFVRDLIEPAAGAEGFVKGIVWRGAVNASQRPPIQAAQNLAQVFLGINLKCASCHDSFVSPWKLDDAYALAGVFADQPLEIFRCDKATGKFADPQFLNSELGQLTTGANRQERQKELARLVTDDQNARLRRTIVNRLCGRFFGRALVEPVDEIDNPAWNEDLLDWLAADLGANGDDLKHLMRQIVTSRAYQLPSVGAEPNDSKEFVFRGPQVRRLTAEQLLDTIWMCTDTGPTQSAGNFNSAGSTAGGRSLTGQWIWSYAEGDAKPGEQIMVRRKFELATQPVKAWAVITCDNEFTLWVNGQQLASSKDWQHPVTVRLEAALQAGPNEIQILARNAGDRPNAAALFFEAKISLATGEALTIPSDDQWQWTGALPSASGKLPGDEADWKPAVAVKNQGFLSPDIRDKLAQAAERGEKGLFVRVALVTADPLMRALGRPIRDQVVTTRPESFTTLEALDLTNGAILAGLLSRGADNLLRQHSDWTAEQAADFIFLNFLSRSPTPAERELATRIAGAPLAREGLADLLWSVVMLPDFQLIR
jgi:mono/diheme cytochrome c family protein